MKALGEHLDVTHNYSGAKNQVVQLSKKSFRFDIYKSEQGYKMVSLSYLSLNNDKDRYFVNRDEYAQLKKGKQIAETDQFIGSFYTNDIIQLNGEKYRVIGVNNDRHNRIELDRVDIRQTDYVKLHNLKKGDRIFMTIGRNTTDIEKIHTDILGNIYKSKRPKAPQLVFKKG